MEPVRFGLVGYGFGGRYFHAPLLAAAPEVEFLGVVTNSPERRDLVAREHPRAALRNKRERARGQEKRRRGRPGAPVVAPAEHFFVVDTKGPLVEGEEDR